jgi:hypothetical protein
MMKCPKCGYENREEAGFCAGCGHSLLKPAPETHPPSFHPTPFANGHYHVKKCPGEGGKKRVYLAHDTLLDRYVASAFIKTKKMDGALRIDNRHLQEHVLLTRYSRQLGEPQNA